MKNGFAKKRRCRHNNIFSKNGFAKKNGAGTTVFSRKTELQKKKRPRHNNTFSKTRLAKQKKTTQAQQYFLEKRVCKKTAQAQQYCLEKGICNRKNGSGTTAFSGKTDLHQENTAQAQQIFSRKTELQEKQRRHSSIVSKNGFTKETAQHNNIFSKSGFATKNGSGTTVFSRITVLKTKNGAGTT